MRSDFDVAIIGSGFTGSMLATILSSAGKRVALIDHQKHPRFAIGESSTPLADLLLRKLGESYHQPSWIDLSTYGKWKSTTPHLGCGLKRGFSYYRHTPGGTLRGKEIQKNSLLVTASKSDQTGDTHWYRSDVDQFFFLQAVDAGVAALEEWTADGLNPGVPSVVRIKNLTNKQTKELVVDWVIDATGRSAVTTRLTHSPCRLDELQTKTYSTFGHLMDFGSWTKALQELGCSCDQDPFNPDHSAQHHLLDEGWIWNLRFDNGITSLGYTTPHLNSFVRFDALLSNYPDLETMIRHAKWVVPPSPLARIQKNYDPVLDSRCLLMPTAAVTIDPLHSTGIAMGLVGVDRLASLLLSSQSDLSRNLKRYRDALNQEVTLLDDLISTAYQVMPDIDRFGVACMLFFMMAIQSEERLGRGDYETGDCLFEADNFKLVALIRNACIQLKGQQGTQSLILEFKSLFRRYNKAGLFAVECQNRYAYTATK